MFERFTDRARRVVVLAQEEARMLNHDYIGTEHLLLGLIHEGDGVAAKVMESLGISLEEVRQQVSAMITSGQQAASGHLPFSPQLKNVLELALREAGQLGHDYIGTEHLLLGIVRERDSVAAQVLVRLGADVNRVGQQVSQLLDGHAGYGATGQRQPAGQHGHGRPADDALARIDSVDRRLAAIERWTGTRPDLHDLDLQIARARREKELAIDAQDFQTAADLRDKEKELLAEKAGREEQWAAAAAERPSLADEVGRLSAEVERLQAILRDRAVEPGSDAV